MSTNMNDYTKKELQKKLKKQKLAGTIHGIIVIILFIISALNTYKQGFSFNSFLPVFFLPMQVFFFYEIKKLKKEIASKK